MNEMDLLETQLRCLKPRRPSAWLKLKLFGAANFSRKKTWMFGSLAPVAACATLTLLLAGSGGGFPGGSPGKLPMMAMVLSNQNIATYAAADFRRGEHNWVSATFAWTNHGNFTSSIAAFPRSQ